MVDNLDIMFFYNLGYRRWGNGYFMKGGFWVYEFFLSFWQIVNNYQQLSVSNVLSVMSVLVTEGLENVGKEIISPQNSIPYHRR